MSKKLFLIPIVLLLTIYIFPNQAKAGHSSCDQSYIWGRMIGITGSTITVEVSNGSGGTHSPACPEEVGIATMVINSGDPYHEIEDQTFFDGSTITLAPGETRQLSAQLPSNQGVGCQMDTFLGELLDPYRPDYYHGRLILTSRLGLPCAESSPPPSPEPSPSEFHEGGESPLPSPSPSITPITCSFTGPTTMLAGQSSTFTSTSTGNITSKIWTVTGGVPLSGINSEFTWTPATAGNQTITLTVAGSNNEAACEADLAVTVLPSPSLSPSPIPSPSQSPIPSPSASPEIITCSFTGPTALKVGETGDFSSTSTGNITSKFWTVTGGLPLSGLNSNFKWTPALSGIQTITLTVIGPSGEAACEADVAAATTPSPSPVISPSPVLSPSPVPSPIPSPSVPQGQPEPSIEPQPSVIIVIPQGPPVTGRRVWQ